MPLALPPLPDLPRLGFDDIIDVRSPAEYAEDHMPGAISLPARWPTGTEAGARWSIAGVADNGRGLSR